MTSWNIEKAIENPQNLTKRDQFAVYYALCPIMVIACRKVGITPKTGYEWKARPSVAKKISQIRANSAQKANIDVSEVLNEAHRIINFDIKQLVKDVKHDPETNYYTITYEDWKNIDGKCIKEVKQVVRDGIPLLQVKPYDKTPYIKMLLDHFKEVKPEQHLHVHMTPQELKSANPDQVDEEYRRLMGGD